MQHCQSIFIPSPLFLPIDSDLSDANGHLLDCWVNVCVSTKRHLFYRMRGWWGEQCLERNESTANAAGTNSIKYLEAHGLEKSACCCEAALHADCGECKFSSISRHTSERISLSVYPAILQVLHVLLQASDERTCSFLVTGTPIQWRSNPFWAKRLELLTQIKAEPKHSLAQK